MKRAALVEKASKLSEDETRRALAAFAVIDTDRSGTVDLEELGKLVSRQDREAMLTLLDDDGDRTISGPEWLGYLGGAKEDMQGGDLAADNFSAFLAYIEGRAAEAEWAYKDALEAGMAPPVILEATHEASLGVVSLDDLREHAIPALRVVKA